MDYAQIRADFENVPSLRLLQQQHAPFILYFLYQQFKQSSRINVPYDDLVASLETLLERLNMETPNSFPRPSREYLDRWIKELHLMRVFAGADDIWTVSLTPDAERVIRWLEELRQRPFVGTESRFLSIFTLLREIIVNSTTNPDVRLAYLRQQHGEIEAEIRRIEAGEAVTPFNATQIRERFLQANENALRLISDFAAVEQSFRSLARTIQEAALHPDLQKGRLVAQILDADEALEQSDEGRSFRAFWQFLLNPEQKDEFANLIRTTHALEETAELRADSILPSLSKRLLDAGQQVVASNQQLAEQLRRMLDEKVVAESQRVRYLCTAIKQLALQHAAHPPDGVLLTLELDPDLRLAMDRPVWSPALETRLDARVPLAGDADSQDDSGLIDALYQQFYVDHELLRGHIERMLETRDTVTLTEILAFYPAQKGIAELLAYLQMAAAGAVHEIDLDFNDQVMVSLVKDASSNEDDRPNVEHTANVRMPRVRFRRRGF